jgi:hypothetical protein
MDVGAIGSAVVNEVARSGAVQSVQTQQSPLVPQKPGGAGAGVGVQVSQAGELFRQLADLAQSNPDKLRGVLAQAAQQLQSAALQAPGAQGQALGRLAERFGAASQTGDLRQLTQPSEQASTTTGKASAYVNTTNPAAALQALAAPQGVLTPKAGELQQNGKSAASEAVSQVLERLQSAVKGA